MENQVIVSDYTQMDRVLREERQYILDICKKIKKAGCNVLLIQKSILRYETLSRSHFTLYFFIDWLIDLLHSSSDLIVKAKWQGKESWFFVVTVSVPLCMSSHQVSFQKKRISWSDNFIVITYDHFRSLEMILPTTKMNSQTSSVCHVYHCRCDSSKTETFLNFIITWRPFSVLLSSTASEVNYAIYFPQGCRKWPCSSFPEQNEDPCCSWHWKRRDWVYL